MPAVNSFSPRASAEQALNHWWLIVLLAVAGALAGWLIHLARPPVYEARAVFFVSIDFSLTGELTQFEEDHAVSVIQTLVMSDPVVEAVLDTARASQIPLDRASLLYRLHLERRQASWTLRVTDPDPQVALLLASAWAEETLGALSAAHRASMEAQALQRYLVFLQHCLGEAPATPEPGLQCSQLSVPSIPEEIQTVGGELQKQLIASQGVFPALIFDLSRSAELSEGPVQYGRNTLVLFGGVIGFVMGIWAVNIDLPGFLNRRLRRE